MGANITRQHADMLVTKLGADVHQKRAAHDLATVKHAGKIIAMFGIRRSSSADKGHAHIPSSLYLSTAQCRSLAICTMSVDQWHTILVEKGVMTEEEDSPIDTVVGAGSEIGIEGHEFKANVVFFNERKKVYLCTWEENGETKQAEFSQDQIRKA